MGGREEMAIEQKLSGTGSVAEATAGLTAGDVTQSARPESADQRSYSALSALIRRWLIYQQEVSTDRFLVSSGVLYQSTRTFRTPKSLWW